MSVSLTKTLERMGVSASKMTEIRETHRRLAPSELTQELSGLHKGAVFSKHLLVSFTGDFAIPFKAVDAFKGGELVPTASRNKDETELPHGHIDLIFN